MRQILLQNAAAILLQNASGFLLQTATVLLQIVTVLLQNATFTNCDSTTAHSVFLGFFLSFCLFFLFSVIVTHYEHYLKFYFM